MSPLPAAAPDVLVEDEWIIDLRTPGPRHAHHERRRVPRRRSLRRALTPRRPAHPGRLVVAALVLVLVAAFVAAFVLLQQARHAQQLVGRMRGEATALERQLQASDLRGAAVTMRQLRTDAADVRETTGSPLWAVATRLPVLGDDVSAARDVSSSVAGLLDAAEPLETALPRLDPRVTKGTPDVDALAAVTKALPNLSAAVASADRTVAPIDTAGLQPQLATGVKTLRGRLDAVRRLVAEAVPALKVLPSKRG